MIRPSRKDLPLLSDRQSSDRYLGKMANRMRIGGFFTLAVSLVAIIAVLEGEHHSTGLTLISLVAIGAIGFGAALAADIFWRALKAKSSVDEREF